MWHSNLFWPDCLTVRYGTGLTGFMINCNYRGSLSGPLSLFPLKMLNWHEQYQLSQM